jgi:hypothetical protein
MTRRIGCLLFLVAALLHPASAQPQILHQLGYLPAFDVDEIAFGPSQAFVGSYDILDLRDPETLALTTRLPLPTDVREIVPLGDDAYLRIGQALYYLDLNDPANPQLTDTGVFVNYVASMAVEDSRLYVADKPNPTSRFRVFDVSDPTSPLRIFREPDVFGTASEFDYTIGPFRTDGGVAAIPYVVTDGMDTSWEFFWWDLSDIANPVRAPAVIFPDANKSPLAIERPFIYSSVRLDRLMSFQMNAGTTLTLDDEVIGLSDGRTMLRPTQTDLLVVGSTQSALVDVADPADLQPSCTLANPRFVELAALGSDETTLLISSGSGLGLWTPDCSGYTETAYVEETPSYDRLLAVYGGTLFAMEGPLNGPFVSFDVSSLYTPTILDVLDPSPGLYSTFDVMSNGYAISKNWSSSSYKLYDLRDASNLSSSDLSLSTEKILYHGGINGTRGAFFYEGPGTKNTLALYDFTDPYLPQEISTYSRIATDWPSVDDIALIGDVAYVAVDANMWVVDFSNLNHPTLEAELPISSDPVYSVRLYSSDNYLYSVEYPDVQQVWSLAAPLSPSVVGTVDTALLDGQLMDDVLSYQNTEIFSTGTHRTIHLVDMNDPSVPTPVDDTTGRVMAIDGSVLFVGAMDGLRIYSLDGVTAVPSAGLQGNQLLLSVHPNPSVLGTRIRWAPGRSGGGEVTVYDAAGRLIRQWKIDLAAGSLSWDGRDAHGRSIANGVYYVQLQAAGVTGRQKLVIVR